MPRQLRHSLFLMIALLLAPAALADGKVGSEAPDFPPGVFNDGKQYRLEDFRGKTVVLFFYEKDCPRCRKSIPEKNKVVEAYKDKPVKFIAVAAGDSLNEAKSYLGQTGLAMPVFADSLSLMEKRYGFTISLNNIWQFRVVGPDGKVTGYSMNLNDPRLEKAIAESQWKYQDKGYDQRLSPVIDLLEWGQYEAGMMRLRPMLKHSNAELAASAQKLMEDIKAEGRSWLDEAQKLQAENPIVAYDLYARTAAVFTGDDLAAEAREPLQKLSADKPVAGELAARKLYGGFVNLLGQSTPQAKTRLVQTGQNILKRYPDTPTAAKVDEVLKEVGGA